MNRFNFKAKIHLHAIQRWLILIALIIPIQIRADMANLIIIGVPTDVLVDYMAMFGNSTDFSTAPDYAHRLSRRDVVEVALVQRALRIGGMNNEIFLKPIDGYLRIAQQVDRGNVTLTGTSIVNHDPSAQKLNIVYSPPLIHFGEFFAGIYTSPDNRKAMAAKTIKDITALRFVVNHHWFMDRMLLAQLKITDVIQVNSWESMTRMVIAGRADALLAPFPANPNLAIDADPTTPLIPIPNFRVEFPTERALLITKQHPDAEAIRLALIKGIDSLHKSGEINRAYTASGFFNTTTASWKTLRPKYNDPSREIKK